MARHRSPKLAAASDSFSFLSACKVLILLSSLVSLPIACFYLYPFLGPAFTSAIPHLWTSFTSRLTPPLLFLLMNLVVGALIASSGLFTRHRPLHPPGHNSETEQPSGQEGREKLESQERRPDPKVSSSPRTITVPQRTTARRPHIEQKTFVNSSTRVNEKPVNTPAQRLGRSKSDKALAKGKADSVQPQVPKKTRATKPARNELQKASVINASPSDAHETRNTASDAGSELNHDVDQRANEYIVQFYQKMKLQRMDSFLQYKGRIDRSS